MKALCRDLGRMDYKVCWDLQQTIFDALLDRKAAAGAQSANVPEQKPNANLAVVDSDPQASSVGTILLVEHPPVYTLGKSGHTENLLIDQQGLERVGATFYRIDRGGDITFHGPGQLVCYPILDLERLGVGLRTYIEALEEAVIRTAAEYGIQAGRIAGASGVWITGPGRTGNKANAAQDRLDLQPAAENKADSGQEGSDSQPEGQVKTDAAQGKQGPQPNIENVPMRATGTIRSTTPRKICAIGVRSSRFITMHGFALNVSTDLSWFSRINPCGFTDKGVTSIECEVGRKVPMDEVKSLVVKFLGEILNVRIYK